MPKVQSLTCIVPSAFHQKEKNRVNEFEQLRHDFDTNRVSGADKKLGKEKFLQTSEQWCVALPNDA
jgi:hypothetical protein